MHYLFVYLAFFSRPAEINREFRFFIYSKYKQQEIKMLCAVLYLLVASSIWKSVFEYCLYETFFLIIPDFNGRRLKAGRNRILSGANLRKAWSFSNIAYSVSIMINEINILILNKSENRNKEMHIFIQDTVLYLFGKCLLTFHFLKVNLLQVFDIIRACHNRDLVI